MKAWWFSAEDACLGFCDGREARVGTTHKVRGTPYYYEWGLHASLYIQNAYSYNKGPLLWLVEIFGKIDRNATNIKLGQICGTSRKYLAGPLDFDKFVIETLCKTPEKYKYCVRDELNRCLKMLKGTKQTAYQQLLNVKDALSTLNSDIYDILTEVSNTSEILEESYVEFFKGTNSFVTQEDRPLVFNKFLEKKALKAMGVKGVKIL